MPSNGPEPSPPAQDPGQGGDVALGRWSLARELEDSTLRRELLGAPASPPDDPASTSRERRLRFTGTGSEYFRIWIVNVLLTLLTLGVYSAWAKVRKARWFAQHTELEGDRFDFHGSAPRILVGRIVAVVLLALWTFSFDWSAELGIAVLGLFCVVGPLLFASAQRFKLANSSWRGLRFGFAVPRAKLYAVCLPLLLLWTAGTVAQAVGAEGVWLVAAALPPFIGLPWAHARLKQMQHDHANFGAQRFHYRPSTPEFYGLYAVGLVLLLVAGAFGATLAGLFKQLGASADIVSVHWREGLLAGVCLTILAWLIVWPYFAARLQQIVWGHTELDSGASRIAFRGTMRSGPFWGLTWRHGLGVLVSCGLWWPFAAVAFARYRVESLVVVTGGEALPVLSGTSAADERQAAGDGAADFFGLDLGW